MKQPSPTLEGFRAIFRVPSLGLAEIAWRWSFAVAGGALLIFAAFPFLDTLPVTSGDLALLRTRQPALISRAALHVFHGSAAGNRRRNRNASFHSDCLDRSRLLGARSWN